MAESDDVLEILESRASQPASATVDGRSATGHNLRDLMEYYRFRKAIEEPDPPVSGVVNFGLKTARIEPGGAA